MKRYSISFRRNDNISSEPDPDYEYEAVRVYRARLGYNSNQYVYVTEGWDQFNDVQKTLYVFDDAITGTKDDAEKIEIKFPYTNKGTIQTNVISGVLPESEYGPITDGIQYYKYWITYDNSTHGLIWKLTGNSDTRKCYVDYDPDTGDWVDELRDVEIVEVRTQDNSYSGWVTKSAWENFWGDERTCTQVWEELYSGDPNDPENGKRYPEIDYPEIFGEGESHWICPISRECDRYRWFKYNDLIYYIDSDDTTKYYGFILKEK